MATGRSPLANTRRKRIYEVMRACACVCVCNVMCSTWIDRAQVHRPVIIVLRVCGAHASSDWTSGSALSMIARLIASAYTNDAMPHHDDDFAQRLGGSAYAFHTKAYDVCCNMMT